MRSRYGAQALTHEQELELILGPGGGPSAFPDDAERVAAWRLHGPRLVADLRAEGHDRPLWGERQYA